MNIKHFILVFSLSISLFSKGANSADNTLGQTIMERFANQLLYFPQEKLYLQTDKPYYSAGEEIWFKGFMMNAATHEPYLFSLAASMDQNQLATADKKTAVMAPAPEVCSQFIYVELINQSDSVCSRAKIRKDAFGFSGNIKLGAQIKTGFYALRAYSTWMQNVKPDFFFTKNIYIGNSIDDRTNCQISYGEISNGKVPVSLTFVNENKKPMAGKKVIVQQDWTSNIQKQLTATTNTEGKIKVNILVDTLNRAKRNMTIMFDDPTLTYYNRVCLPTFITNYDLQFLPESGVLLSGISQFVAFKAIGADGLSIDVSGKIFSNNNEEITEFETSHKGMGKFLLEPKAGETYYALIKAGGGSEKRFNLPVAQTEGVAMHLQNIRGKIMYQVFNQTNRPNASLYLLIHTRGKIVAVQPLNSLNGQIVETALPVGINSFAVIDSVGNTFCERLIFANNYLLPTINMLTDKAEYGNRELVNLKFDLHTSAGEPLVGNFSVSITDSKMVESDSLSNNILSYFLLTSDLKGYIENPGAYFADSQLTTREKLDVLLMTQGWRRFNTADVLKGIYPKPSYLVEDAQAINGKVTNIWGKPAINGNVYCIAPKRNGFLNTTTDSLGRYSIPVDFPDSTWFVLKTERKKSLTGIAIKPDADVFPTPNLFFPNPRTENAKAAPTDYFQQSKEKYFTEGGMRVISLKEVTVTSKPTQTLAAEEMYTKMADRNYGRKELERYRSMGLLTYIGTIPGFTVRDGIISFRGESPMLVIDSREIANPDDVSMELSLLTTEDVANISIITGAAAAFFATKGANGVIVLGMRKDISYKRTSSISLAVTRPLGYQKPTEFYVPKYEIDSIRMSLKADLRTTIFWNPNLQSDNVGMASTQFFTADKANDYTVTLEGVGNKGEICRYVGKIKRK